MATATKIKGFNATCPMCHDEDSTVTLDLNDLSECRCSGCDAMFSAEQARDLAAAELAKWERVVKFVEMGRMLAAESD